MTRDEGEQLAARAGAIIGYGRLMQLGQKLWREQLESSGYPSGGEFSMGPCVAMMVPCPCTDRVKCDWCCGTGQVTQRVADAIGQHANVAALARRLEKAAAEMMRASNCALRDGDRQGAIRERVVAAREYTWAAELWMSLGDHRAKMACFMMADRVRAGTWTDAP